MRSGAIYGSVRYGLAAGTVYGFCGGGGVRVARGKLVLDW
jgi:hypothetical protein